MTFFYDLNKKLDGIRATPELTHSQLNEGAYRGGPDKSQIPAVNRPGNKLTTADLEKERTQSPTSAEGMRALQDRLSKINPMDEVGDTPAGLAAVEKIGQRAGRAIDDAATGYSGSELANPDKTYAARDRANSIVGRERIRANDKNPTRVVGGPNHGKQMEEGLPMVKGPDGKMLPKFAADGKGPNDLKKSFTDKIDNAKKEVDEMLGDVAAEAMKSALSGGQKKLDKNDNGKLDANDFAMLRKGNKQKTDEEEDLNPFTNYKKPRVEQPKRGSVEQGSKHDIKHDTTDPKYSGRIATRRVDPNTGHSVGADDDTPGEKRGRGRPGGKGAGKSIGAKGPSGKSKLMTREGDVDVTDQGEYDQEGEMAKDDIKTIVRHAHALEKILGDNDNLPEWVQSKLAKIQGMMTAVDDYMQNQEDGGDDNEEPIAEKATSKKQQKFMGMVHAAQKGEKPASKEVGKVAKTMKKSDAEDFASTKHKGLPEKNAKKKEEVEETTVAGSIATAPSSGKAGNMFGKGVYEAKIAESFNKKLNTVLKEGMSVNMSVDQDGRKNLTVSATDEDAVSLSKLLNLAGIDSTGLPHEHGAHSEEPCSTCGESPCGCEQVEETLANSPDEHYSSIDTMLNTLGAGLDGRKESGQTTLSVVNRDPARGSLGPVIENKESRLWELYNRYESK